MDTKSARRRNQRWPEALKREIVVATLQPGASVAIVARQYDVNANQVFAWRRRFRDAAKPSLSSPSRPTLVPVTITAEPDAEATRPASPVEPAASDVITIEVSGTYLVHVGANFDGRTLQRVLDVLGRARGTRENGR